MSVGKRITSHPFGPLAVAELERQRQSEIMQRQFLAESRAELDRCTRFNLRPRGSCPAHIHLPSCLR